MVLIIFAALAVGLFIFLQKKKVDTKTSFIISAVAFISTSIVYDGIINKNKTANTAPNVVVEAPIVPSETLVNKNKEAIEHFISQFKSNSFTIEDSDLDRSNNEYQKTKIYIISDPYDGLLNVSANNGVVQYVAMNFETKSKISPVELLIKSDIIKDKKEVSDFVKEAIKSTKKGDFSSKLLKMSNGTFVINATKFSEVLKDGKTMSISIQAIIQ